MAETKTLVHQGAEAKLYSSLFFGKCVLIKERFPKKYRHPKLDETITKERTKAEAKYLVKCRKLGILTPSVFYVDLELNSIYMENLTQYKTVREEIHQLQTNLAEGDCVPVQLKNLSRQIGQIIGRLHKNHIIHGDLTTSNMLVHNTDKLKLVLIDFGLSHTETATEDKGVDLYVLERAILASHPQSREFFDDILSSYKEEYSESEDVLKKLNEVRLRGRKRTMVG